MTSFGDLADAMLEQFGYSEPEEIGNFPQVIDLYAAVTANDFANPRGLVTTPNS